MCLLFICPEVNSHTQSLSLCYLSAFPPLVKHLGIFKIREHFPIDVQNVQNFLNCCHCLYFTLGIQISLNTGEGNVKMWENSISVKLYCDNLTRLSLGISQSISLSIPAVKHQKDRCFISGFWSPFYSDHVFPFPFHSLLG